MAHDANSGSLRWNEGSSAESTYWDLSFTRSNLTLYRYTSGGGRGTIWTSGSLMYFSYTLPAINSHADATITQSWDRPTPYIVQIQDTSSAIPLLCTNWWVTSGVLSVKVYNIHNSNSSSHSVTFRCVY